MQYPACALQFYWQRKRSISNADSLRIGLLNIPVIPRLDLPSARKRDLEFVTFLARKQTVYFRMSPFTHFPNQQFRIRSCLFYLIVVNGKWNESNHHGKSNTVTVEERYRAGSKGCTSCQGKGNKSEEAYFSKEAEGRSCHQEGHKEKGSSI